MSIILFALLLDTISTYCALLFSRFCFEHDPSVQSLIRYLGKEIGLLVYFFIFASIYVGMLFLLDLYKFYITEGTFSISLGFGHSLAGISNISIYLNILWIHFALREFLSVIEGWLFVSILLIFLVEFYYKKRKR
jgi:hypothetical protein